MVRIAIDAMGGDHAPANPIGGAPAAARHLGIGIDLVGPAERLEIELALKLSEGLVEMVEDLLGAELQSTFTGQMGYLFSRRAFRRFRRRVDYSEYGGAPLLRLAGVAVVCHGRSSAKALRNAVAMAARLAQSDAWLRLPSDVLKAGLPCK